MEVPDPATVLCPSPSGPAPDVVRSLPDFLVISPPKTGSSWLAANLHCHPALCIARVKEVRYFSSYYQWLDLSWYVNQFREKAGCLKGEASPSYSLLPRRMIRALRTLLPRVKLIFLMRDPVGRAWSHARHNFFYREANFHGYEGDLDTVPDHAWRANFRHPWPATFGDYLGQLRRWLAVFPPEQFFIDSYEQIKTDPVGLLSRLFTFLGVGTDVDWSAFRTREVILAGPPKPLSAPLKRDLQLLFQDRTRALDALLQEQFGLSLAEQWPETLAEASPSSPAARAGEADDDFLHALLQEIDAVSPLVVEERFHGYGLVLHHGRFLALPQDVGNLDSEALKQAAATSRAEILTADSLPGIRAKVLREGRQGPHLSAGGAGGAHHFGRRLGRLLTKWVGPARERR